MKKRYNLLVALIFAAFLGYSQTATLPLTTNFDSESQGSTTCSAGATINLTNGVFSNEQTTDDVEWSPDKGGTTSSSTGPSVDHTLGNSSGYYLYLEGTSCFSNNYVAHLESEYMNLSTIAGLKFEFWYHMYGSSMGSMHIDVRQGNGAWTLDVVPSWTDNQDLWQLRTISIFDPAFVGNDSVQVRIRGLMGPNYFTDMAIDDVSFTAISGLDLAASALASPSLPACAGSESFSLEVTNNGTDTITTFKNYFSYNGTLVDSTTFTGQLLPGASTVVLFANPQIVSSGVNDVLMYTVGPNGGVDASTSNDTLRLAISPALAGNFTLDATSATSGTNYASFTDLSNDLTLNGVCGPVVVDVVTGSGPYNEQVNFSNISGTSSTNTITINGNGETLSFAATLSAERATLTFDNSNWISVDDLNIDATGTTYSWGVHMTNGSHHIELLGSTINSSITSTSSANAAAVIITGSKTSLTTASDVEYVTIDSCILNGGYYGITARGTSGSNSKNFRFTNNTVNDNYAYGIYLQYSDSAFVEGNDVSRANRTNGTTYYGISLITNNSNAIVNANTVHSSHNNQTSLTGTVYPFQISGDAVAGSENYFTNNLVYNINSNGTVYALYDQGSDGTYWINNTISLDHVSATGGLTRGFYQSAASSNSAFMNNVITITRGGTGIKHGIYLNSGTTSLVSDYNDVFVQSAGSGAQSYGYLGADYSDLASWSTTSNGVNSFDVDPAFVSLATADLTPTSGFLNNVALSVPHVTTDFTGAMRTATPDIGAFEFSPPPDDASISNVVSPQLPVCPGTFPLEVEIANLGSANLTSARVVWNINGTLDSVNYTGNLSPGSTDTISLGNITIPAGVAFDVSFYTKLPNATTDANPMNDSLIINGLRTGVIGNVTVDPSLAASATNYLTITDLVNDLNVFGVCGPVTAMVAPGVYNESVLFGNINGVSATNTVTIDGGDSATTIVNGVGFYTFAFSGASYITLRNLGINNTNSTCQAVILGANSTFNVVENCAIKVSVSSTSSTNNPIGASNSLTTRSTNASGVNDNTIQNNRIVGGYYGVYFYGGSGNYQTRNRVLNNQIDSTYYYGVYGYYVDSMEVSGNVMDLTIRANTNADGIYSYYSTNGIYEGNNVHAIDYGFYIYAASTLAATTTRTTVITNNMIISEADYGLYLNGVDDVKMYHNTIVANGPNTTSSPAVYIQGTSTYTIGDYDVRNNIFIAANSESFETATTVPDTIFSKFDNNIFNTGGSTTVRIAGTNHATLADYVLASPTFNTASLQGDPIFTSATDLHLLGSLANDVGDNTIGVGVDIDGDTRPALGSTSVDIGADEFSPPACFPVQNLSLYNITADSLTASWDGSGNSYQYSIVFPGMSPLNVGAIIDITALDSIRLGGLTAGTSYEIWVREICGRADSSSWTGPLAFRTMCTAPNPAVLPYFQGFETFSGILVGDGDIDCSNQAIWTFETSSQTDGRVLFGTSAIGAMTGNGHATLDEVQNNQPVNQMILNLDLSNYLNRGLELSFDYFDHGDETHAGDKVWVRGSGLDPWVEIYDLAPATTTDGVIYSIGPLDIDAVLAGAGQTVSSTFAISFGQEDNSAASSQTGVDGISFDNILVEALSPLDAGVVGIASPQLPLCGGSVTPVIEVKNHGTDTLTSFTLVWNINGVIDSVSFTGSVAPDSIVEVTIASFNIVAGLNYDFYLYTKFPNLGVDGSPGNDTLAITGLTTGLAGNFTIDSSMVTAGTNFQSFTDFANTVNAYGICGTINVDVVVGSGPYNEQIELEDILGTNSTSFINLNGNGETIEFASTNTNQRAVIALNNVNYINIDSLNINADGGTYGWGIHMTNGTHDISVTKSNISTDIVSTSSVNFGGVIITGSNTSMSTASDVYNVSVDECTISGGYYGISARGTSGSNMKNYRFTNNTIQDNYAYGIYLQYSDSAFVEGNDVSRATRTNGTTFYGISLITNNSNAIVNANAVHSSHNNLTSLTGAVYPFQISGDAVAGNENYFTNNLVYNINSNGTIYGFYDQGADGTHYINNTISLDHVTATGGTTRALYQSSASSNSSFVNNIITISRGGSGAKHGIYLNAATTSMVADYNDVYLNSAGTGAISYGRLTADQATLNDWQTNTTNGSNSHESDPEFNNLVAFDLTPKSGLINSVGLNNPLVTTDYFGVTRSLIPDLGAISFTPPPSNNLGFATLTEPNISTDSCYGAAEDVIVTLINAGGIALDFTVSNATITVDVTGATTQTLTHVLNTNTANGGSPLGIGATVDINMGTISLAAAGNYNFDGLITMVSDTFPQNDTLVDIRTVMPVSGGTIDGCDLVCNGDTVTLTVNNSVGMRQWQSFSGGTWTDIPGADSVKLEVSPTASTQYRVLACGTVPSDTLSITIISVAAPTATGGLTLAANCNVIDSVYGIASSTTMNATFNWYDSASGGNNIITGGNYWVSEDGDSLMYRDTPAAGNPAYDTVWVEEVVDACSGAAGNSLLITEADPGDPDALEIQNVSNKNVDVTGWSVAISDNYTNINTVNTIVQTLSGTMAPGQIMDWSDLAGANYWGNNIFWNGGAYPSFTAWILIIDNNGEIVDFLPMNWLASDIATMSVTINGFTITPGASNAWIGDGVSLVGLATSNSVYRVGNTDNNDMSDFIMNPIDMGTTNTGLLLPFAGGGCTSVRVPVYLAIDCTVGIENEEFISSFNVSPNPSNGEFKLNLVSSQAEKLNLTVRDVAGKIVYTDILNVNGSVSSNLDFTSFAKGVYFMQVKSGDNSRVEKLIIK